MNVKHDEVGVIAESILRVLEDRAAESRDKKLGFIAAHIVRFTEDQERQSTHLVNALDSERMQNCDLRRRISALQSDNNALTREVEVMSEKLEVFRDKLSRVSISNIRPPQS